MECYRWPGNVRELANIVERLAILHAGADVTARDVSEVLGMSSPDHAPAPAPDHAPSADRPLADALDDYERALITQALTAARGKVAEAARHLQTDRPNLYRRLRRLGIEWHDE